MAVTASTPLELIEDVYRHLPERVALARKRPVQAFAGGRDPEGQAAVDLVDQLNRCTRSDSHAASLRVLNCRR